jgi:hypothetical protein
VDYFELTIDELVEAEKRELRERDIVKTRMG